MGQYSENRTDEIPHLLPLNSILERRTITTNFLGVRLNQFLASLFSSAKEKSIWVSLMGRWSMVFGWMQMHSAGRSSQ